jgi:hypothetical protein
MVVVTMMMVVVSIVHWGNVTRTFYIERERRRMAYICCRQFTELVTFGSRRLLPSGYRTEGCSPFASPENTQLKEICDATTAPAHNAHTDDTKQSRSSG